MKDWIKKSGWLQKLLWGLLLVGLVAAVNIQSQRHQAEGLHQGSALMVDYDELIRIAQAQNMEFEDVVRKVHKSGATGLVVRERILDDWVKSGDLVMMQGNELALSPVMTEAESSKLNLQGTYLLTKNSELHEMILQILEAKRRHPQAIALGEYLGIEVSLYAGELPLLGVGFPRADLEIAAKEGLDILPRVRNWAPVNQESIEMVGDQLARLPNLQGIAFNDETLPGGDNPNALEFWKKVFTDLELPLVTFEFYPQGGAERLAELLEEKILRAHAIADNELRRYNVVQAVDRFRLAVSERNIRIIYLRFFGMDQPVGALDTNLEYIEEVARGLNLENQGPADAAELEMSVPLKGLLFLVGLGILAAGLLLLEQIKGALSIPYWNRWIGLILVFASVGWAGLLQLRMVLALKMLAFLGAVIFPSLAVLLVLPQKENPSFLDGSWQKGLIGFLKMSAISLLGALMMSALLTQPMFMLKLNSFAGVKLAHLIPLALVPAAFWIRQSRPFEALKKTAASPVLMWHLLAGGLVFAALFIYIMRTGNTGVSTVSNLEMTFRQLLDTVLGVRPRTKEFLIGHPLMLLLLIGGYRFERLPVLLMAMVGQISLVNTYAHLHTPLMISLIRSFHGLWIGLLLGLVLWFGLKITVKMISRN